MDEEEENQSWLLTAPTVSFFFWDLAQTGLYWFEDTKAREKKTKMTDIGLSL